MKPASVDPRNVALRTAAVWGTNVLATALLARGEPMHFGAGAFRELAHPAELGVALEPIRAAGSAWELDATGATGGMVMLRGRREDPVELGRHGIPVPLLPGDYGILQYGQFSVFFQFTRGAAPLGNDLRVDWPLLFAFFIAIQLVAGFLLILWSIAEPAMLPPLELLSGAELRKRIRFKEPEIPEDPKGGKDDGKGNASPDKTPAKTPSGGKRHQGAEGRVGATDAKGETKLAGETGPVGGLAAALADPSVAKELRATLAALNPIGEELKGLGAASTQFGAGSGGAGLRGSGGGGGGTGPGALYGAGNLGTGPGSGPGGPGGGAPGSGGPGGGGNGGPGTGGPGERQIGGKTEAKAGSGLSMQQVARVVGSRSGSYRACYEMAAAKNPSLKGCVSISISITPSGSVASASVASNGLGDDRAAGCIARVFSRLSFPAADKPTNTGYPVCFKPSK